MLGSFMCGTFHREEEDEACHKSSDSPSRKSKRSKTHIKASKHNNPYSTRGLDKFSALLADLNEKRQKIYSQMSPHEISFVRFVYTNTDDFVPVVVKRKHKSEELRVRRVPCNSELMDHKPAIESSGVEESRRQANSKPDHNKEEKKRFSLKMCGRRPSSYMPVVIILILMFLTMFGRSATTLCTCIVWYVVPTLKDSSKSRKSMKKKDYVRGLSEKKTVSDGLGSPRKHGHQKSW